MGVLDTIYDTVATLLRGTIEKRALLDSMELVLLAIDETVSFSQTLQGNSLTDTYIILD